jgi:hypothetical protein
MIRSEGTHSCIITAILGKQVPFAIIEMQVPAKTTGRMASPWHLNDAIFSRWGIHTA